MGYIVDNVSKHLILVAFVIFIFLSIFKILCLISFCGYFNLTFQFILMVVKDYYDLLNNSSDRTRNIIYILVIASIVILIPFWNVRSNNWVDTRIGVRKDIIRWQGWDPSVRRKLSTNEKVDFDRSKTAASIYGLDTNGRALNNIELANLENQITEFEKVRIQKSFIPVPVFNVIIDINDLGLLGGFAFVVILSMLRASLWRELAAIKYIFHEAEMNDNLREVYQMISMSQVLMTPPNPQLKKSLLWGYINLSFLGLPFIVHLYSIWINLQGLTYGLVQNPFATYVVVIGSFFALFLIAVLTYSCLKIVFSSDRKWTEIAKKLSYI